MAVTSLTKHRAALPGGEERQHLLGPTTQHVCTPVLAICGCAGRSTELPRLHAQCRLYALPCTTVPQ
eukprot:scaffold692_cov326-Prasinococcus_capsulatus_cf.AAC.5